MDLDVPKAHPSSPQIIPEEEKLDHRRRRRNRMRASCLNCYASKRKCDKKRPCGRCVRLGTTGLCIYEVEDIGDCLMDVTELNEIKRLRQRIAELESVIRELKKNPHPRWTAPGGMVHDPNFFDSFRKSTLQAIGENACLSSGNIAVDLTSMGVKVKAEEYASCPPELIDTAHSGVLRGLSHAHSPQLFRPTVSRSGNSEVTVTGLGINPITTHNSPRDFRDEPLGCKSTLIMGQAATSVNPVTACNSFTTNSSGGSLSVTRNPRFPNCAATSSHGFQPATSAPTSHTNTHQLSPKNPNPCNCLTAPMAFGPLLHLGISLRTSREALERLHPLSSDCVLYCHISMLEKHIFSVPPHEQKPKVKPSPGPCMDSCPPRAYATTLPHSYSKKAHEYLFPHPHSHSYLPTHPSSQLASRSPDPFAYMSDTTVCTPLHR